jgi:phosphoglycerate dehydrogenase-like enzyme
VECLIIPRAMPAPFHLKLTADFFDAAGRTKYDDIGLSVLAAAPHISHVAFAAHQPEISPGQLAGANGVMVLTPKVTAQSVSQAADLLVVSRFGVGYDSVDVKACTAADVAVCITSGAVDRPVAEATVGWMIALTHHVRVKDQLVRTGGWDTRPKYMGSELRDRTLGLIGLGGIARTVLQLLANWGMSPPLVYDPFLDEAAAAKAGVRKVTLEELLRGADFVSIHCPLTEQTRGLIGAPQLALMRPTAYLLNTARGGIVDEAALYEALKAGRLAGAALDCFAQEPVLTPPRLAELDNVLFAPHCIAWTNELFRDIGRTACQGMIDLSLGQKPRGVVNPEVFEQPSFQGKWRRVCRF